MNIARTIVTTKLLSILFSALAAIAGIRFLVTPWQVSVHCDQRIHPEVQKSIIRSLENMHIRSIGADGLNTQLQQDCPLVSSVSISYKGSLVAHVSVNAHTPWVCLDSSSPGQKEYILCKSGLVIEKKHFNELVLQEMPQVSLEVNDYMQAIADADILRCALQLRRKIYTEYALTWKSKVEIIAKSKIDPIVIIADSVTIHENERFTFVDRIFNSDKERYKNGMKADIRLRDEIICSPL